MRLGHDQRVRNRARALRSAMSPPEILLWSALRRQRLGLRFRRQHPAGPYILDFFCPKARLCVEVDGLQHDQTVVGDAQRDHWLAEQGIRVLRVQAADVTRDVEAVTAWIALSATPPPSADG